MSQQLVGARGGVIAPSIKAACARLGVSRITFQGWRSKGMPGIRPDKTVDLDAVSDWLAKSGREVKGQVVVTPAEVAYKFAEMPLDRPKASDRSETVAIPDDSLLGQQCRLARIRADKLELEVARQRRETVLRSEVAIAICGAVPKLFNGLDRVFCTELPGLLVGLTERQIAGECKKAIDRLKEELQSALNGCSQ